MKQDKMVQRIHIQRDGLKQSIHMNHYFAKPVMDKINSMPKSAIQLIVEILLDS